jgi:hypothetical protein
MSTANLDAADLIAVDVGGLIREDVLEAIFDISRIPLPFTDSIGTGESIENPYTEWTTDDLGDPVLNAVVDGSDAGVDESTTGLRVGNHSQESQKTYRVSQRAQNADTIGRANELAYQVMRGNQKIRRDVEQSLTLNQASIADDGNAQPGLIGGFPTWLTSSVTGGAGFAVGGFDTGTSNTDEYTPGVAIPISETDVRDIAQSVYEEGGDPSILMSVPGVIRQLSEYMFTSSARIATLTRDTESKMTAAEAMGSVNVFITDFGVTLSMVSNRLQALTTDAGVEVVAFVFIYDPAFANMGFLQGYQDAPLAKTGLADNRQITVDYSLRVLNEAAHGMIGDVDPTLPGVA